MNIKAFVVIDINVIVSALVKEGFSKNVLELVDTNNLIPVYDKKMLHEYYDHISREELMLGRQSIYDVLLNIVTNGIMVNDVAETKARLEKELIFLEVKEEQLDQESCFGEDECDTTEVTWVTPKVLLNVLSYIDTYMFRNSYSFDLMFEMNMKRFEEIGVVVNKGVSSREIVDNLFQVQC